MFLPGRLLRGAQGAQRCACPCHGRTRSLPPRLFPARNLTTTPVKSKPAAQLAEREPDYEPSYYYSHSPSVSRPTAPPPLPDLLATRSPIIQFPSPLPSDISALASDPQSTLYPTTGVIDSISMISICLRRSEHVPRAYQIFLQLIDDAREGNRAMPEAEVWANVIEGVAGIGRQGDEKGMLWRRRAQKLIDHWETHHQTRGLNVVAGAKEGGVKLYSAWFAGMIKSNSPADGLVPYLQNNAIHLSDLLSSMSPSDMPLAYEELETLARREDFAELEARIDHHRSLEKEKRDILNRESVQEVKPVLDTDGRNLIRRTREKEAVSDDETEESTVAIASEARFAVRNLRQTLSSLQKPYLPRERQMSLERASWDAAAAELKRAHDALLARRGENSGDTTVLQRSVLQGWMYQWLGLLKERLAADIKAMQEAEEAGDSPGEPSTAPRSRNRPSPHGSKSGMRDNVLVLYLSLLPVDKLALITIIEIMRQCGSHGVADVTKALRGMLSVGKAIETEYRAETIKNVIGVDSPQWLRTIDPSNQKPTRVLVDSVWRKLGRQLKAGETADDALDPQLQDNLRDVWTPPWSQMTHLGVGSHLVKALLDVAKVSRTGYDRETGEEITEEQPAFTHGYDYLRGRKLGVIRINPVVAKRLSTDDIRVMIHPKHLPMLVEPRAWRAPEEGGYLVHRVPVMRYKDSPEQKTYLQSAAENKQMEAVFHGLDVLSSTPWAINRKVFDVVLKAWNSGDPIADIPASEQKSSYDLPKMDVTGDPVARAIYVEKAKAALAQSKKDHAERCKFNYNIEIARAYLNETFYLPHSMDFRGRAYPIPPHLSPVGDDLCRGLLTFGTTRPLGKTGLKWLQIHLANVYGFDKASFEDRARFSQDHEAEIFDSADNPLGGSKWWLKAEEPWQCLAACNELAAALRSDSPELYESSLPVHQDGTCNGMQHYAALGGDVRGARAVNLENGDRPADIYTGVADVVNKVIEQDKAAGHDVANLIPNALGRKVVKQTVMTTVYGVTYVGARDQIAKQLSARGDISPENIYAVSSYVAKTVLSCIGDLFSGAKNIMEWLTTSARLIARSVPPERVNDAVLQLKNGKGTKLKKNRLEKELMTSVVWTSPLGLPVVQPYRKAAKRQVMTALQSVYISDPNAPAEVSPQKQATAFPPNYIHSLDATHMLLTAVQCKHANITFASVHDSYWTHASTVEPMSELIREMFVLLHRQDLVGQLREEFLRRYGDHRIPVKSARAISTSITKRRTKDAERRKQIAALLGEDISSPIVDAAVEGAEASVDSALNESPASEEDAELSALEGDEGIEDEDGGVAAITGELDTEPGSSVGIKTRGTGLELTNADLAALQKKTETEIIPEEIVEDQRFVRFRDVLPPAPKKGAFDVNRIKESAYFFS